MPALHRLDALDARIRAALHAHPDVTHALAYGSRTQGTVDAYSDLEHYAFTRAYTHLDPITFLRGLTPVALSVTNSFSTPNLITPDLVRIELHVEPDTRLNTLRSWTPSGMRADCALIRDDTGRLQFLLNVLVGPRPHRTCSAPTTSSSTG